MIDRPGIMTLMHDQCSPIVAAIFTLTADEHAPSSRRYCRNPRPHKLKGFPPGDDNGLPADVQDEFRLTGTSHSIAISG